MGSPLQDHYYVSNHRNGGFFHDHGTCHEGRAPGSRAAVESLPRVAVTEEEIAGGDTLCGICLDEIRPGEDARQLPCSHRYHGWCAVAWLRIRNTCPLCRHQLPVEDSTDDHHQPRDAPAPEIGQFAERLLGM